ncbi:prepilin peptidase [Parasedimentitalea huanghaiensis]|uniref:Prepilin type IV endopeptidase peptidase domain-containing protein n=1 Tax=Parasedimentitalea huanghaiensis TaxID=2682100 RepID=A0A6L6WN68_9RHOB|nr:A24 family peptidase [Zongyanglinia huanghaiensis]MVO18479.1 hypothetical protein [Zongyanglinia huanghaiensis]
MRRIVSHRAAGFGVIYTVTLVMLANTVDIWQVAMAVAICPPLIWLSQHDLTHFEIPDLATGTVVLIAIAYHGGTDPGVLLINLIAGAVLYALLWAVGELHFRRTGGEGLGIGDAKLFGAGAVLLGPWQLPEFILLSSVGGIVGVAVAHMRGGSDQEGIPFGPFIAYSMFVLIFFDPLFL